LRRKKREREVKGENRQGGHATKIKVPQPVVLEEARWNRSAANVAFLANNNQKGTGSKKNSKP